MSITDTIPEPPAPPPVALPDTDPEALANALAGPAVTGPFQVETLDQAEWAMRKLHRAMTKVEQLEQLHAERNAEIDAWLVAQGVTAERDRLDRWLAESREPLTSQVEFFRGLLEDFHRRTIDQELAEGVRPDRVTKSVKLPHGKLASRKTGGAVEVTDEDAPATLVAVGLDDCVTATVSKSAVKQRLADAIDVDDTGRMYVVDEHGEKCYLGLSVTPEGRSFTVEVHLDDGHTVGLRSPADDT